MHRIALAILIFAITPASAATCKGEDPCKACRDCTQCKYCTSGKGSCSILRNRPPKSAAITIPSLLRFFAVKPR